jgi:hypothetical protein
MDCTQSRTDRVQKENREAVRSQNADGDAFLIGDLRIADQEPASSEHRRPLGKGLDPHDVFFVNLPQTGYALLPDAEGR